MDEYNVSYHGPYNSKEPFALNYIKRYSNDIYAVGKKMRFAETDIPKDTDYHLIFSGSGSLVIETQETTYNLPENSFLIYKPQGLQRYIQAANSSYVQCVFSGSFIGEFLKQLRLETNTIYKFTLQYSSGNMLYLNKQLEYIGFEYRDKKLFYSQKVNGMFLDFLASLARNVRSEVLAENPIETVIKHIKEHIRDPLEVDELIAISHLSRSRFYCAFKEYTGTSPINFMRRYRLDISKDYLSIYPKMPVSRVSTMVGFSDSLYFSRLFKQQFGVSPMQYRKQNEK